MRRVSVSQAKDTLSACLAKVREGESILITDRGKPVAMLAPVSVEHTTESERLASLTRRGIVRAGKGGVGAIRSLPKLVKIQSRTAALEALDEDRED
jgi:prevent-host-death family protein